MDDKKCDKQKKIDNLVKSLKEETPFPKYTEEDYVSLAKIMLWHIDDLKNNFNFIKAYDKYFWETRNRKE